MTTTPRRRKGVTVRVGSSPTIRIAERQDRWQAPTGRWLEPGKTFTVKGHGSQKYKFIALVLSTEPHIEAIELGNYRKFRCFRPEDVRSVSNKILEDR